MTIAIENLSFAYGRFQALRAVNASALAGRITAVIGPNAAGKSTLLRCVIGALRPTNGRVLIDGEEAHRLPTRRLAQRIAYVPQRSIVAAAFTVRQVIELGRYSLPPSRARVDEAIERLDLADVADRPYPELSVGQQQRVTLARALAQLADNGHLILDEPMSAMDLRHVHETVRILRELAEGGVAIVLAMHDLTLAAAAAHEFWLLHEGRLVASGGVGDVLQPTRLEGVFGVAFKWLDAPGGPPILLAQSGSHAPIGRRG